MSRLLSPKVLLTIAGVIAVMVASAVLVDVPLAHIQLAPEPVFVLPGINFPITNTLIALLTADVILIGLALVVRRGISDVPSGLHHLFEVTIEYWRDMSVQLVGEERTKRWLPVALTMFFLVTVSSWMELLPGFDSVGLTCTSGTCPGEPEGLVPEGQQHTYFVFEEMAGIPVAVSRVEEAAETDGEGGDAEGSSGQTDEAHAAESESTEADHDADEASGSVGAEDEDHAEHAENERVLVPFYRVPASDLNFTLALALIAFTVVELAGIQALGLGYLSKFFSLKSPMAFFVGLIELLSEFARIISFSFRLFGNLFAGQVILFIMPFLVPFLLVLPFYGYELFVGIIQGFIFAILTLVFMSIAIEAHDSH